VSKRFTSGFVDLPERHSFGSAGLAKDELAIEYDHKVVVHDDEFITDEGVHTN